MPYVKKMAEETKKIHDYPYTLKVKLEKMIRVPRFSSIPGFHLTSLFFIANNFVDNHSKFMCQGMIDQKRMYSHYEDNDSLKSDLENDLQSTNYDFSTFFTNIMKNLALLMEDISDENNGQSNSLAHFYSFFSDRNPYVIDQIVKCIEYTGLPNYTTIDFDQENDGTVENILEKNALDRPVLIYSRKGITSPIIFPLKMLIGTSPEYDPLFSLFYAIGSQEGIPVLFFFANTCIIKIYDNQTLKLSAYDEALKYGTILYFIAYMPRDLNYDFTCFTQAYGYGSSIHGKKNPSTDDILENFLDDISKEENWNGNEINFIDYIIRSIEYPAFFARGFDVDEQVVAEAGFYAMICLGSDKNAKDTICEDTSTMEVMRTTIQEYGYFTLFVRMLIMFMKSIDQEKESDFDIYLRALFRTLPIKNLYITVCFYHFIVELINKIPSDSRLADKKTQIETYIEMTVEDPSQFLSKGKKKTNKKSSISGDFANTFTYSKLVPSTITPWCAITEIKEIEEMKRLNSIINIKEFSNSITVENYKSFANFKVFSKYEKFLTQVIIDLAISL